MAALSIIGLHHIQLAIPQGKEDVARAFYGSVLGFIEEPKPAALTGRGGVWFRQGNISLHLGVEDQFHAATKAHPAFEVTNLEAARTALVGHRPTGTSALPGLRRFYVTDPFGNRIEILQAD